MKIIHSVMRIYFATPVAFRWLYWVAPIVYFIFPIDLFPDVIPGLGRLDDLLLLLLGFWVLDRTKLFREFFKDAEQAKGQTQQGASDAPLDERPAHEVLGVAQTASHKEIKKAYRVLLHRFHPDRFSHLGTEFEQTARRKTEAIIKAYKYLSR